MEFNELDIERYLLGDMDLAEAEQFQLSMQQNPALNDEVKLQQALMNGIINNGSLDIKSKLDGIHEELFDHDSSINTSIPSINKAKQNNKTPYYILAAVLLAFLGFFLYNYLTKGEDVLPIEEDTTLYAAHYQAYPLDNVRSGADANIENQLITSYQAKDYDTFLKTYSQLSEETQKLPKYVIARGTALLERGNTAEALAMFYSVYSQNEAYKDAGLWYSALCHIKDENNSIASDTLQRIVDEFNENNPYARKATQLLEAMKE